jgi:hypothetical protein
MWRWAPETTARLEATIDRFRRDISEGFGPLNGQTERRSAVHEAFAGIAFELAVETGTFRGTTAEYLSREFGVPVYTVEIHPRFYHYSSRRFRGNNGITLLRGDSTMWLRRLAERSELTRKTSFFYLDAHWGEELPLRAEIQIIVSAWSNYMVIIDDFQVPGDPGYGFDDYGDGKRLCLEYLPEDTLAETTVFWPSAPSRAETGGRRGYVVLASPGVVSERLSEVRGLTKRALG